MLPVTRSAPSLTRTPSRGALGALAVTTVALLMGGAMPAQGVVLDPSPGETVTVDFPYTSSGQQYTWVVPEGVTEITVDLAAGSGANGGTVGEQTATGGPGGRIVATVSVVPGETLSVLVGGQGSSGGTTVVGGATTSVPAQLGGGASAMASVDSVKVVAGGGGAAYLCDGDASAPCSSGGAGGFSASSATVNGQAGGAVSVYLDYILPGTGATAAGPGASVGTWQSFDNGVDAPLIFGGSDAVAPTATPVAVAGGVISLSPGAVAASVRIAGGGSGYFGGGHGGAVFVTTGSGEVTYSGGGGGGSGYLTEGAQIVELRDNVGNGFASISYVVPEAPVADEPDPEPEVKTLDPEPELVDATEPTLVVSATEVRAGGQLELSGGGFPSDRAYPIILNSDPVLLGDVTTDARGAFATTVTIPATVHPGAHVISVGDARIPITVLAGETVPAPPTVLDSAPQPELAATGTAETLGAAGLLALTMLALGGLLLRRVRHAEHV